MDAKEIRELFKRHNVPLSREDVWEVQGNPVVKHQALERLSSILRINWHKPEVLRSERDEAVLIVTGNLPGGPAEWSIGEAVVQPMKDTGRSNSYGKPIYEPEGIGNYTVTPRQAAYPYAMAEKRAKDRVILKLAGMYGSHSEEEADDFKQKPELEGEQQVGSYMHGLPPAPMPVHITKDSRSVYVENSLKLIEQLPTPEAVSAWLDEEGEKGVWKQYGIDEHQDDGKAILMACKKRRLDLRNAA